jgi:glutamate-ammonia-ligase adenylyltransferase
MTGKQQEPASMAFASPSAAHSRFVQRIRRRYEHELPLLPDGLPDAAALNAAFAALTSSGHDIGAALRIVRQLVMERLAVLDCEQSATLEEVTGAVTVLGEWALDLASGVAQADLDELHGAPRAMDGQRARWWIVGMGKFGARELNVSSDIDLIYVYETDGETAGNAQGRNRISNHEYFGKAVKRVYALIGDNTEHGFVFRVDLALRPNGNSGPPALSLAALEEYFQIQGREWERLAWLKSRVVAPASTIADGSAQALLRPVVLPFVFRRYLDYRVFDALRSLHAQIREHASRRSAGRPERANDVKLSRGGIREIEFTVQILQVVRGGQFPELRSRPTLHALQRVARAGLMPQETADALAHAYRLLRRIEHRAQYLDDQQTHLLPVRDDDLAWIAATLGFADVGAFLCELDRARETVAQEFDRLLGGDRKPNGCKGCGPAAGKSADPAQDRADGWAALADDLPPALVERYAQWKEHPRVRSLSEEALGRLLRIARRTNDWVREGLVSEAAALRLSDWLETLLRRPSYLAMLVERPVVHQRVLRLLGAARWPARYMQLHPAVMDELADAGLLDERFDAAGFEEELERRLAALVKTGEDDEEALLNLLRRAHHAEVFRTLARDLEGRLSVEQVADDLSALADALLRTAVRWCWARLRQRHRDAPRLAIVGYGKLGGKELGYGSDLDIVFAYDDDDDFAPEVYTAFVRKLITWFTVKTADGDLFEIDTELRPNGSSGLLVTSFEAYARYQQNRGSNTAWTWEHQAITRARCVLGDPELADRFEAVREAVITAPREAAGLRQEIARMRGRVRTAHPTRPGRFDLKHSPGGMMDAEFVVQYLVLSQSAQHSGLRRNIGNIALLAAAEAAGLLEPGSGARAGDAYRELRRLQHRARLDETPADLPAADAATFSEAILSVWRQVLGDT